MVYFTGDTHGQFNRIEDFCRRMHTTKEDILVILGDAGINYYRNIKDMLTKEFIALLPITLFCIHGNHEERPYNIDTYISKEWHGGVVYFEESYDNILFAKDGELYDFDGVSTFVIGGAYSVDKYYRLARGLNWFKDEQPSDEIKQYVESQLDSLKWKVDLILTHTVPKKYEPTEFFLKGLNQDEIDKTTEEWLDIIESKLDYKVWLAGHYHHYKKYEKLMILFEEYYSLDNILQEFK